MINDEKIYYTPGQVVMVKHDIENKPRMFVIEKVTKNFLDKDGEKTSFFVGIKCGWFDAQQIYREGIFSTKDLIHV